MLVRRLAADADRDPARAAGQRGRELLRPLIHDRFERIQAMFSDISSRVQENLSGVRVIRAYVQEEAELRQFEKLNREFIARESCARARSRSMFMPLLQALIGITFLIVLWAGGYGVLSGTRSAAS